MHSCPFSQEAHPALEKEKQPLVRCRSYCQLQGAQRKEMGCPELAGHCWAQEWGWNSHLHSEGLRLLRGQRQPEGGGGGTCFPNHQAK